MMIKKDRILKEFEELISIDSLSFAERDMADRLKEKLTALGFEIREDNAGAQENGTAGNVYGYLKGTLPGDPILFSAHMDTVRPGIGKKMFLNEATGKIESGKDTILGADDVTGLVEILEAVRHLQEEKIPHRDIEVVFPIAEELYIKGTDAFDFSQVKAKEAYVLDMGGAPGTAALRAPSLISFTVKMHGKASHAGFAPEQGIHAIRAVSLAISKIEQGHVDEDSTLNIGKISGGEGTNIIPELCTCEGEIRSYSHEKAMETLEDVRHVFETAVKEAGAELSFTHRLHVKAFHLEPDSPVAVHFAEACRTLGIEPKFGSTFGGSDGNTMMQHGIPCAVLSCGMYEVHSVREYAKVGDIVNGARLIAELITQGQEASIE